MTVIDPILIPHFTGNVDALEQDVSALAKAASGVRGAGADIHSTFQGISPAFDTPEREQLLAATLPVRQRGEEFARQLETVKSALAEYAAEIRPIVKELKSLADQATAFQESIRGDDHWRKDQKKFDRNKELIQAVAVAQARFHAAEMACANKINALSCRPAYRADDGSHQPDMYGYKPGDAAKAKSTPWGEVGEREYAAWDVGQMVRGFAVDNVVGMVKGFGVLLGTEGEAQARQARKSMLMLAVGSNPASAVLDPARVMPDSWLPKAVRDYKHVINANGKAFVAWDEWRTNPSRAGGTFAFNGLTTFVPFARAAAVTREATTVGRVLGGVARVGEVIDPMTHVTNAGGKVIGAAAKVALPKIGDVAAELNRSLGRLEHHAPIPADRSVKLPSWDGETRYLDHDGTIRGAELGVEQPGHLARREAGGDELTVPQDRRVLAHAGVGGASEAAHPGGSSRADTPIRGGASSGSMESVSRSSSSHGASDSVHPGRGSGDHHASADAHHHDSGQESTADGAHDAHSGGNGSEHVSHDGASAENEGAPANRPSGGGYDAAAEANRKGVWPIKTHLDGPAGNEEVLKRPNPRHTVGGAGTREVKPVNSVILRGYTDAINRDIAQIAEGRAKLEGGNHYVINGRSYGVERGGTVIPVSGPGIVQLDRNEYAALQQIVKAKGNLDAAPQLTKNPRFVNNPEAVQKALDIYHGTYE
ncbi:hypothetical protein [Streptomyces morookaense]|uniref:Uncharacterized protein n=1 Tax=Streptomyces morookaense TaxID=1970 RepID=A0A7Y7BA79_STRMO|nr:hypothetical protein [Streptomyces morookaense]NVK81837.1 hypothetical protein [Streptomyces morookaense]GHF19104.1 hypothetical protein GCM10010359_21000 [Streptomyces morookaense]